MPTPADMQTRFPEAFASTPPAVLEGAIGEAYRQEAASFWGADHETAVLYRAAHLAAVGRIGGAVGIASAGAGPTSVSFAQGAGARTSSFLDMYESLRAGRLLPMGAF